MLLIRSLIESNFNKIKHKLTINLAFPTIKVSSDYTLKYVNKYFTLIYINENLSATTEKSEQLYHAFSANISMFISYYERDKAIRGYFLQEENDPEKQEYLFNNEIISVLDLETNDNKK